MQPYASLAAYAKAIQLSPAGWFPATALRSLAKLEVVREKLSGYDWAVRLLSLPWSGSYGLAEHRPAA